ncbi:MAG: plastocyanin/azurin family copper-binding protein, partial [Thermoproteota archaeon]|nr:plastocyanin/azurin family copper-binding protein [Thermoproteota archaeon]
GSSNATGAGGGSSNATGAGGGSSNATGAGGGSSNATASNSENVSVSVVPGSSTLTDDAYSPNPVEVAVGQTVVWTNDDNVFHTVTSGTVGADDAGQQFDSGLTGPTALTSQGKTFEHTFDTAGEFPYFCTLHPNMVGTVIAS